MSYEAFRLMVQGWASSGYLPEALAYGFVVNALLAGLLIGPVLGGLGTLVVVKRFAFFSEAVGHAALTGVAIGILLGEPYTGPYGSLFGYCLLFGILLNYLRNRTGLAPGKTPLEVEQKLLQRIPAKYLVDAHHWLILHGRYVCQARKPQCGQCAVAAFCGYEAKTQP